MKWKRGVQPNNSTFDILVSGWSRALNGIEVRRLHKEMKDNGFKPDKSTVRTIRRSFSGLGMRTRAQKIA
jgi:pentatricopeptide repeat protein